MKEAGVVKSTNPIMRGAQLLTGSRARALESQAANRGQALARNVGTANRVERAAVFGDVPEGVAQRAFRNSNRSVATAQGSQLRSTRAAAQERAAVSSARKDAMAALGSTAVVGGGAMALGGRHKMANAALDATVAAGSQAIRKTTNAIQKQVVRNNTPLLTGRQKLMAGGAAVGLGGGAMMAHHSKQAGVLLSKEAFGAAMLQGIKGIGQFAQTAGKGILNAGKAGGMQAAGQAAMNAGRSGLMRAGNYIAQNPGAGAALVAAPAMAVGYAAGRQ